MHRKAKDGYDLFPPAKDSSFTAVWKACEDVLGRKPTRPQGHQRVDGASRRTAVQIEVRLGGTVGAAFPVHQAGRLRTLPRECLRTAAHWAHPLHDDPEAAGIPGEGVPDGRCAAETVQSVQVLPWQGGSETPDERRSTGCDTPLPLLLSFAECHTRNDTEKISPEARALRAAIEHATDPEKTFFEDLPNALHLSLDEVSKSDEQLGRFVTFLSTAIDHLQQATPRLVERIDAFIGDEVLATGQRFPETRTALVSQLEGIREHQLLDHLTPLFKRTMAPLDQSEAWTSSVAEGAIGKPLSKFTDRDEELLKERLLTMYRELISLADLHLVEEDPKEAPAVRLQITTSSKGTQTETIQYPLKKKATGGKVEEGTESHVEQGRLG